MNARFVACLYANLCSIPLDYAARQKVGGVHLKYNVFRQLPSFAPSQYTDPTPWNPAESIGEWLLSRVVELTYTAWDLKPFAEDCGCNGPPYIWDPKRRFQLQCEIDAAFFHLYGISREDTAYVLDSFPVVARSDERTHGEYRTKRVVLEVYDALGKAVLASQPYVSPLGPPRRAT